MGRGAANTPRLTWQAPSTSSASILGPPIPWWPTAFEVALRKFSTFRNKRPRTKLPRCPGSHPFYTHRASQKPRPRPKRMFPKRLQSHQLRLRQRAGLPANLPERGPAKRRSVVSPRQKAGFHTHRSTAQLPFFPGAVKRKILPSFLQWWPQA